jgi:hypothetical protein
MEEIEIIGIATNRIRSLLLYDPGKILSLLGEDHK